MSEKPDPTKDPEFQRVIRHFVTTPPKLHEEMKMGKPRRKRDRGANSEAPKPKDGDDGRETL